MLSGRSRVCGLMKMVLVFGGVLATMQFVWVCVYEKIFIMMHMNVMYSYFDPFMIISNKIVQLSKKKIKKII